MDIRRISWSLLLILAAATAISGVADELASDYAENALNRALVTFAAARTLNGVISVAQSTEVGVGVTVSVGQILDPVNDLIEQFSAVMLVAASSLGLQTVLLNMTSSWGVTALLLAAAGFSIATLWVPALKNNRFAAGASRILLIMLSVRFLFPLLIIATNIVSDAFLAPEQIKATAALEGASATIEEIRNETETSTNTEQSVIERLGSAIDESLQALDIRERLATLKESASNATEHVIDLIVLFVLQTVLLPLSFVWIAMQLFKGLAGRLSDLARSG